MEKKFPMFFIVVEIVIVILLHTKIVKKKTRTNGFHDGRLMSGFDDAYDL